MSERRARWLAVLLIALAGCKSERLEEAEPALAPTTTPASGDEEERGRPLAEPPGWPERAHGQAGAPPVAGAPVRLQTPDPGQPRPGDPVLDRPRLGLVVVRDGQLRHAPRLLLDLEGRLDGAVDALLALSVEAGPEGTVDLAGLARAARTRGLDLLLVDVAPASAPELGEAWLVRARTGDLLARFSRDAATVDGRPVETDPVVARLDVAWRATAPE